MVHLIDKDALVAETEKFKAEALHKKSQCKRHGLEKIMHQIGAYNKMLSFIDTLEVREVDLDKETTHYLLYEHCSPLNEIMHKADLKSEMQYHKDIEKAFKAGFELGIQVSNKAQKGEEA